MWDTPLRYKSCLTLLFLGCSNDSLKLVRLWARHKQKTLHLKNFHFIKSNVRKRLFGFRSPSDSFCLRCLYPRQISYIVTWKAHFVHKLSNCFNLKMGCHTFSCSQKTFIRSWTCLHLYSFSGSSSFLAEPNQTVEFSFWLSVSIHFFSNAQQPKYAKYLITYAFDCIRQISYLCGTSEYGSIVHDLKSNYWFGSKYNVSVSKLL